MILNIRTKQNRNWKLIDIRRSIHQNDKLSFPPKLVLISKIIQIKTTFTTCNRFYFFFVIYSFYTFLFLLIMFYWFVFSSFYSFFCSFCFLFIRYEDFNICDWIIYILQLQLILEKWIIKKLDFIIGVIEFLLK